MILRKAKTARGKEKQLEKELPWFMIPEDKKDDFRGAERLQWDEHVKFNALEPVGVEYSRKILATKERVLNSRFAYKDKLWSRRKQKPEIGWKPKARLVIGGHMDRFVNWLGDERSDGVPTRSSRPSSNCGFSSPSGMVRLRRGHTSAFLNGGELQRELCIRQPKSGLHGRPPSRTVGEFEMGAWIVAQVPEERDRARHCGRQWGQSHGQAMPAGPLHLHVAENSAGRPRQHEA